jgi:hypothetical protein
MELQVFPASFPIMEVRFQGMLTTAAEMSVRSVEEVWEMNGELSGSENAGGWCFGVC